MKNSLLKVLFIIFVLSLLLFIKTTAQENLDPSEIKVSSSLVYQGLNIEITSIKRVHEYQAYFRKSTFPRGRKLIAQEGNEIAIIQIHTTNLMDGEKYPNGEKVRNGIYLSGICIFDSDKKEYKRNLGGAYIGSIGDAHNTIYKENDFEFTVEVPQGIKFSEVQLHHAIKRGTQPYTVIQKITFDLTSLKL